MRSTRRAMRILVGLALFGSACAKPHPAEGLRPLPLLTEHEALIRNVASLRPQLYWEPFPRPVDIRGDKTGNLARIQDVTYELRIWRAEAPTAGSCVSCTFFPSERVSPRV